MKHKLYFVESILAIIFGAFLLINTKVNTLGAVVGLEKISQNSSVLWGSFFLILGVALFVFIKVRE